MINDNNLPDKYVSELKEIQSPTLYVNVDFNELLSTHTTEETFELIGKLKDLLS